ncbi:hypothetical protein Pcinc_034634 [Petrolisthes cinctipes]|uniref:Protein-serine O-palmitoleoyltransferase porcupine n=1 Tax=Petrolisthes cinctipes TaxID=88211 RepID=A0AAE1EP19_PETCI|nr:hypothetical protein Pcinc_034634 [Petrolisthes cinctipes]
MEDYAYADYDYEEGVDYVDYYEEDVYELPKSWENLEDGEVGETSSYSLAELYEYCVVPTVSDSAHHLFNLLVWSFIFTLTTRIVRVPSWFTHVSSAICGSIVVWGLFGSRVGYVAVLASVALTTLVFSHCALKTLRGPITCCACIAFLVICEVWWADPVVWHSIRGPQMVVLMKLVSVGFDLDSSSIRALPGPLEMLGYILNPGTIIFGPWLSFNAYMKVLQPMSWGWWLIPAVLMRLISSVVFLLLSTCYTSWILPEDLNRWGAAYRDALSFRSSHYFVSYMSEMSALLAGLDVERVAKPVYVEMPRSLVEVVIYWNMPMHYWLKTYIFKTARSRFGIFLAIIFTYAMSAIFHGLNFQLAAVLLSLGFYTYVEHSLRIKLASAFDACVLARPCPETCSHQQKGWSYFTLMVNFVLGAVAVFHLAYLGIMFGSSSQEQESGYSMTHTLSKWSGLNFASHWVVLICYIVYALI